MTTNADIPRFAADRMLGRLARWLRLCGVDVRYDMNLGGSALLRAARAEARLLLTRDKRLRTASDVLYLGSERMREQLAEVLRRFAIDPSAHALTRCSRCNATLHEISRETVMTRVPPFVYASNDRFAECDRCGHIYWPATHHARILEQMRLIRKGEESGNQAAEAAVFKLRSDAPGDYK